MGRFAGGFIGSGGIFRTRLSRWQATQRSTMRSIVMTLKTRMGRHWLGP